MLNQDEKLEATVSTTADDSISEVDMSTSDQSEAERVEEFFSESCGCKLGPKNTPCPSALCKELGVTRNDCIQLERSELDLVVLAQFQDLPDQGCNFPSRLYFHKLRVCLKTFVFIHAIIHKRFEALQKHFDSLGLVSRTHGNTKRLPKNTRPKQDTFRALGFIDNFSEIHGLPLPGRMPNHRDSDVVLLPSDMSKSYVYGKYVEACRAEGEYSFSRRKFKDVWREL